MQTSVNEPMLGVVLLGYDFYKLGHRSAPDTPIHPGDPVQLVVCWRAQQPVTQLKDEVSIRVETNLGKETPVAATFSLAGVNYPVEKWQAGEIIRAQYDFFLGGLEPGRYRLGLTVRDRSGSAAGKVVTGLFTVE